VSAKPRKQLDIAESLSARLIDALPLLVSYVDRDQRYRFNNRAYEEWFRVAPEQLRGKHLREVLGEEAYEGVREHVEAALAGSPRMFEGRLRYAGVGERAVRIDYVPDRGENEEVQGFFAVVAELNDLTDARDQLRTSEARMRAVVDAAAEGIITMDTRGVIQSFNAAAKRIFGYEDDEVIGRNVNMLMPPSYAGEHDDYLRRYLETGEKKIVGIGREVRGRRKDGTTFPLHLSVSEIQDGGASGFAGIVRDLTQQRQLEKHLADAQVEERRRLAQDIHDSLGGQVAGVAMLADLLRKALEEEGSSQVELAAELAKYVRETHALLRQVSRGLLPVEVDEHGLTAALKELVARLDSTRPGSCTFVCERPVTMADNFVANHLFRIVEEAAQNALRHAEAEQITIGLENGADGSILVTVHDNGIGFDESTAQSGGMGLHTMRYRADLIGARLRIVPADGGGTVVKLVLPRQLAANHDNRREPTADRGRA
jgi:PAS domain S-box-containing protein